MVSVKKLVSPAGAFQPQYVVLIDHLTTEDLVVDIVYSDCVLTNSHVK